MKVLITTIACLLFLGVIGCSTDQTPTEVTQIPTGDFDKVQPDNVGAVVIHYEDLYYLYFTDIRRQLIILVGIDLSEYCDDIWNPDTVDIMEVTNPQDQYLVNQLVHGSDLHCVVYPYTPGLSFCDFFATVDPVGTGFVDLVSTDNDLYAWVEGSDSRVNSYMISANGALTTPDGGTVQVSMMYKIVWPGYPADPGLVVPLVSNIMVSH